jgi:hypothetical protein
MAIASTRSTTMTPASTRSAMIIIIMGLETIAVMTWVEMLMKWILMMAPMEPPRFLRP